MRSPLIFAACLALLSCSGEAVDGPPVKNPDEVAPRPAPPSTESKGKPEPAPAAEPDALEASVRAMTKIKRAFGPSFSPDGKRIAFISDISGVPSLYTVPSEGGAPERVPAPDDQVRGVTWSPDGAWLAFAIAPGGGMNQQIYLARPDGKDLRRLTDGGKDNNWLGRWSFDAKALTLSSNRRDPAAMDGYIYDVPAQKLVLVSKNPGTGNFSDVRRDRSAVLLSRVKSRGSNDLFYVEVPSGKEVLLTPHEGPGTFFGRFSADGKTVYLGSNKDRDKIAFAKIKLGAGGKPGPITIVAAREDAELQSFDLNEQGTTAALVWNVGGKFELVFLDLKTEKSAPGPKLPAEIAGGLTFSKDGNHLAMVVSGSTQPPNIWTLDVRTGVFKQITTSPTEGVKLDDLIRPELVEVTAHDGLKFSGWLYRPKGASKPGPIVLSFHGGPEGQELPSFRDDYQALLSQGIAVFAPNVRGSSGFGKKFVNLDNGALRVDAVKDIKACIDYVVRAGIADPKRIGIAGGSYGGYMTMAGLTEYPDLIAAGANLFGIVNFATFFKHSEPWMGAISKIEYGDPDKEAEMLRSLSPIHKLDRVKSPTIVLHGANDTNVPVIEAEQVVENLKKRGVPVEYVLFPDEGHGFSKTENRIRASVAMTRWFSKHLKAGTSN